MRRFIVHTTWLCICILAFLSISLKTNAQDAIQVTSANNKEVATSDTVQILKLLDRARLLQKEKPDSAVILAQSVLQQSLNKKYLKGVVGAYLCMGKINLLKSMYMVARSYYMRAITYCATRSDISYLALLYTEIATTYQFEENMDTAIQYNYKALKIVQQTLSYDIPFSRIYNNLAAGLVTLNQNDEALYYLDKAQYMAPKEKNESLLGYILMNKGIVYSQLRQREQAVLYFKTAWYVGVKQNNIEIQARAGTNLGKVYIALKQPEKAITFLLAAEKLKSFDISYYNTSNTAYLGDAYRQLKSYKEAEKYYLEVLRLTQQGGKTKKYLEINAALARLYTEMQDYKKANDYRATYMRLYDSVKNSEMLNSISKLEVQYRTAQKDKELTQQLLQISQQKNLLRNKNMWITGVSAGALILIIIAILLYILYRNNQHKQKIQEQQIFSLQQIQENSRLRALMEGAEKERSRLAKELHDGVGGMLTSLNMNLSALQKRYLSSSSSIQEMDVITSQLKDVSETLRTLSHNLMPDILIKYNLTKALEYYLDIIDTRSLNTKLHFYGDIDQLSKQQALFVYRIVQELVQNILKHARARQAEVQLKNEDGKINITVEDDGNGFDANKKHKGMGLLSIQTRVQAMGGYFSIESGIGIGTTIYIQLDVDQSESRHGN